MFLGQVNQNQLSFVTLLPPFFIREGRLSNYCKGHKTKMTSYQRNLRRLMSKMTMTGEKSKGRSGGRRLFIGLQVKSAAFLI